jgi:hypothetical protein
MLFLIIYPINYINKLIIIIYFLIIFNGDWGLGIGDWGLGIGPNPQSPIPNPHEINWKSILWLFI